MGELKFDFKKINWKDVLVSAILFYVVYFISKKLFPITYIDCPGPYQYNPIAQCSGEVVSYPFPEYYLVIFSLSFILSFLYYFFFNKKHSSSTDLVISFFSILIIAYFLIPLLIFLILKIISLFM